MAGEDQAHTDAAPQTAFGWLAFGSTVAVVIAMSVLPRGDASLLRGIGVAFLITAPILFVPPFFLLARHGGVPAGAPYYATTRLVDRWPYTVVRHPQYLGYAFLTFGFALLSQHAVTACLAAAAGAGFYFQGRREEAHCLRQFGDAYRTYMQRVPAFNAVAGCWRVVRRARS